MISQFSSTFILLVLFYGISATLSFPFVTLERFVLAAVLAPLLVWLSCSDMAKHEIPDGAAFSIALIGAAYQWRSVGAGSQLFVEFGLAGLLTATVWMVGGLYYRRTGREAIGIGDAKLIGAGSLVVGGTSVSAMIFVASMGGIVAALLFREKSADGSDKGVPFGPFLAYSIFIFALFPLTGSFWP